MLQTASLINLDTPVEVYTLSDGTLIEVKREDLQGDGEVLPPWGKLYGMQALLRALPPKQEILHLSVKGSYSAWALARLAYLYDGAITIAHATKEPPYDFENVGYLRIRPNVLPIMLGQVKKLADKRGAFAFPYGMAHEVYYDAMAERACGVETAYRNIVVSCGTGASLKGLLRGFDKRCTVYAICTSSRSRVEHLIGWDRRVVYRQTPSHNMPIENEAPFPCNGLWDAYAWRWLEQHVSELPDEQTLFWNLGG